MYAIRSYYVKSESSEIFLDNPKDPPIINVISLFPEIERSFIFFARLSEVSSFPKISRVIKNESFFKYFKIRSRITSYNVCYTKLLRKIRKLYFISV